MKFWITAAMIAAVAATMPAAQAADAVDESGTYFGGGVGEFNVKINDVDDIPDTIDRYDTDDTAYKLFGGFRANQWFGMEAAYVNLGNPEDEVAPGTFVRTETDGFAPYVVGTLPLGPFELFAKAGYYFYDTKVRVETPLGTTSSKDSDDGFTWSTGVGLTLAKTFNLRLEYEEFDIQDVDNANALWLTAGFRF